MPVYGFPDRGSYDRTREAVRKVNREFPAAKRDPKTPKEQSRLTYFIGKPTTALTSGPLTGKFVQEWRGPAWGVDDAATGRDPVAVHYAVGDFATTDYVVATLYNGKWYVSCFVSGA